MYKAYPTETRSSIGQKISRPFSQQKQISQQPRECKDSKISQKSHSQSCDKSYLSTILKGKDSNKQQTKTKMKPQQLRYQYQQPQSLQTTHRYNQSPYVKNGQQQQLYELQKTVVQKMNFHSQQKKQPQQIKQQINPPYDKVAQSLNGSFELKKRILTTNLESNHQNNSILSKGTRAQSVMDEYKTTAIELQQTLKIPEPILPQRIIPYDSETEYEGYRKGDFLTIQSDGSDNNETFFRKEGIEHFLKNLSDKEILLLEKYIYLRKYDMMARNNNKQQKNQSTTSRTTQQRQQIMNRKTKI